MRVCSHKTTILWLAKGQNPGDSYISFFLSYITLYVKFTDTYNNAFSPFQGEKEARTNSNPIFYHCLQLRVDMLTTKNTTALLNNHCICTLCYCKRRYEMKGRFICWMDS